MSAFLALIRRDLALAFRIGGGGLLSLGFFLLAALLIPLGVGPEGAALARIAAGVVWVCALLACLLSLDRLFQADLEDGSLDQLALGPLPLEAIVLAKAGAHWIATGLPLTLAAPVIGVMLNLAPEAFLPLLAALLIGAPALSLAGAVGAALTAGVRRGGLLLSVLVLPLYVPTLIFGAQAADRAATGLDPTPALAFLGAVTALAAGISPFAAAAALRVNLR
ncbi:heme exporter protein CcmB [uncultured Albimonas sp.]|uniref:heme exporter protein CcmB n=1 Tax=uncultured Albimonas sp. TaxID=1331701 RepID=UPI0030EBC292|tara:strand:+ start:490 stop:1155 length:666 start_codon:yes stop_codon:yes gene_type:complete